MLVLGLEKFVIETNQFLGFSMSAKLQRTGCFGNFLFGLSETNKTKRAGEPQLSHLVDGISDIFLLVLVVKTLSPAVGSSEAQLSISDTERVPQRGLVPQPGVEDTLHGVAGHVRGREG